MKLRLRNNSVRLRLTQGDVERFRKSGVVEESIVFGPGVNERLTYALVSAAHDLPLRAVLEPYRIIIYIAATAGRDWTGTDRVGVEGEQQIGGGGVLKILVEKDFTCLERRAGSDDADTFENPDRSRGHSAIGDQ